MKEYLKNLFTDISSLFVSQRRLKQLVKKSFVKDFQALPQFEKELYMFSAYNLIENNKLFRKYVNSNILTSDNFSSFYLALSTMSYIKLLFLENQSATSLLVDRNILNVENLRKVMYDVCDIEFAGICENNSKLLKVFFDNTDTEYVNFIDELKYRQQYEPRGTRNSLTDRNKTLTLDKFNWLFFRRIGSADRYEDMSDFMKDASRMRYYLKQFQSFEDVLALFGSLPLLENLILNNFHGQDIADLYTSFFVPQTVYDSACHSLKRYLDASTRSDNTNSTKSYSDKYTESYLNDLEVVCRIYHKLSKFSYSEQQRRELVDVLRGSKISQELFDQLAESNLLDTYDFESLKSILTKDSKKKKLKLNF